MKAYSKEKKNLIQKFQDAIGNSKRRLEIIKNINKKESTEELGKRLNIPQPTISEAINRFKSYNLITFINKKGKSEVYDKISLLKTFSNLDSLVGVELQEEKIEKKKIKNKIRKTNIPFLEYNEEKTAQEMVEPYVILYLFENSLRKFIDEKLKNRYGTDWWNKMGIKTELKNRVKNRKEKEGINKWHVPRGASEIFYTDLTDLTYFINKERAIFGKEIDIEHWTATINKTISLSRNIVDHHNPLPKREVDRLKLILGDWKRQFK